MRQVQPCPARRGCTWGPRDVRGELVLPTLQSEGAFSMRRATVRSEVATRKLIGCRKAGQRLCLKPEYSRAG